MVSTSGGHHRLKRRCQEGVLPGRLRCSLPVALELAIKPYEGSLLPKWPLSQLRIFKKGCLSMIAA